MSSQYYCTVQKYIFLKYLGFYNVAFFYSKQNGGLLVRRYYKLYHLKTDLICFTCDALIRVIDDNIIYAECFSILAVILKNKSIYLLLLFYYFFSRLAHKLLSVGEGGKKSKHKLFINVDVLKDALCMYFFFLHFLRHVFS